MTSSHSWDTASPVEAARPSEWASLLSDLGRRGSEQPEWRVHDRTHLEFALDYPIVGEEDDCEYEWEAYFFIPESLRINSVTYSERAIYSDLQSYVRFSVPEQAFADLLDDLEAIRSLSSREQQIRSLRLLACQIRASALRAGRDLAALWRNGSARERRLVEEGAAKLAQEARDMVTEIRALRRKLEPEQSEEHQVALRWIEEDVSRVVELVLGRLSLVLAEDGSAAAELLRDAAVAEVHSRRDAGLEGVTCDTLSAREVEHLEFRRHVLKRFTSSVLWLHPKLHDPKVWVLHVLYAVAAAAAMSFAIIAALWNGLEADSGRLSLWLFVAVIAYAAKDRIKAALQSMFAGALSKRFPDRRWRIYDSKHSGLLARLDEVTRFVAPTSLPEDVLAARCSTGRHAVEAQARPETVLAHRKRIRVRADRVHAIDERFDAISEIFRLDLRRWLSHTDDPKREILYADVSTGCIRSAKAPRVYNINVVYRLRRKGSKEAGAFRRVRVVVTRKGIRRLDDIGFGEGGPASVLAPAAMSALHEPMAAE